MRIGLLTVFCCFAVLSGSTVTKAAEELTGQARAEAVGEQLIGMPAPRLVLKTIDGQQIDLGKLYGKQAVYLKFWATWCVPCREQMPHFEHVYQTRGSGLTVIAIDSGFNDSLEEVQSYREKQHINMPIVLDDGRLGEIFHLRVTPQHIIIGRDGRVQFVGHLADDRLDAALLAAQQPTKASAHAPATRAQEARAYGIGDQLPDFTASTVDGRKFQLRDPHNHAPTILVFMSPWCESYLAKSRPAMSRSCKQVREQVDALVSGNQHLRWIGIASGLWATSGDLKAYQDQNKVRLPLALDDSGKLFRAFRIMSVPTLLITNHDGYIASVINGFDSSLPDELLRVSTH